MNDGNRHQSLWISLVLALLLPGALGAASRTVVNAVSTGNGLYCKADYAGAIAKYQEAIDEDATYPPAWGNKALAHARLGEFVEAETACEEAVALAPTDVRYLVNQGKILAVQGKYEEAIVAFAAALELDPAHKQALFNRGWCQDELGEGDAARADYEAALLVDSNYAKAMLGLALLDARDEEWARAIWWCKQAACLTRTSNTAVNALARRNLQVLRGNDFSFALDTSPASFSEALSLLVHDRAAEALVVVEALAAVEPDSPLAHLLHSLILTADGQHEAANTAYAAALALLPTHTVDTIPAGLPVFADFQNQGQAPVALPLFPATHDLATKDLPNVLQSTETTADSPTAVALDTTTDPAAVNLAELVQGTTVNNALRADENYRIGVDELMGVVYGLENGLLGLGDLADYSLTILSRTGFYGQEGDLIHAAVGSASPNIAMTVAEVFGSGQTLQFSTAAGFPAYPQQRDVNLTVNWQTSISQGAFVLRFLTPPPTPPIVETFEADSIDALADYWSFGSTAGTIALAANLPHGGTRSLRMGHDTNTSTSGQYQEAMLRVDLADAPGHVLDYWVAETGGTESTATVAVSVDGTSWVTVHTLPGTPTYQHCAIDLDSLGLVLDDEVFIRFRHDSYYAGYFQWDDIRIAPAGEDVFGPHVLSVDPIQSADPGNPVTGIRIEFDESIDASTLTVADISLITPDGSTVAFSSNPVDTGDGRTFAAPFANDVPIVGVFFVTIGPQILDLAGNLMDQDANGIPGDAYGSSFTVSGGPGTLPFVEDFEQDPIATMSHWVFSAEAGEIVFSSAHAANGVAGLAFIMPTTSTLTRSAISRVDLHGQTGVTLDFMVRNFQGSGRVQVSLSVDGTNWHQFADITTTSGWQHRAYNLDAIAASRGWAFTEDTRIRFVHSGSNTIFSLDDVRIATGLDLFGPQALSHAPTTVASGDGPLARITVTFDEPVDPASFAADDVLLKDPQGAVVTPGAVTPVAGSGDTQFDLDFAARDLRGTYRLTVGPQILDLAGNPMNQNGSAVNGEAADAYGATVDFRQTVWTPAGAEPELYAEGFEDAGWDGGAPAHWSFIHNGNGTVRAVTSGTPYGGMRHLRLVCDSGSSYLSQYATLAVDLSSMAGRTDLSLNFRARSETGTTTLYVELSGDGVSFQNAWSTSLTADYTQYALDLSALTSGMGIALDENVFIRFRDHGRYGCGAYLDDVRITAGLDLEGPQALSHAPTAVASGEGPLARITVTFDEPVDAASFAAEDVLLKDPQGAVVAPVAVTPVAGSGDTQFDLDFAARDLRGTYRLTVGPQILDLAGNPMNQNGSAVNGEAADTYGATVDFRQTAWTPAGAEPELYAEGFEDAGWDGGAPAHWSFIHNGNGTVRAVTSGTPYGGMRHLRLVCDSGSSYLSQYATLAVDLSSMAGRTDLSLNFRARRETDTTTLYVELSGDGVSFQNAWSTSLTADYTLYALDLSALTSGMDIALDENVFIRFRDHGRYGYGAYLDDVRITAGLDLEGPQALSHAPAAVASDDGPLARITVTFDEPVDPASFAAEDVLLKDPQGVVVTPVTVTPVAGSGDTQFDLDFAAQSLRGTYRLTVGPQILDLAGNPMNQNGNAVNGEAADAYGATVDFRQTARTDIGGEPELYAEGFEDAGWDGGAPAHWSFIHNGNGTVRAVTSGTPYGGMRHLRLVCDSGSSYLSQYATLAVDLSSMAGRTDLSLNFRARRETDTTTLYVELSGDGVSFQNVWSTSLTADYTQYALDLSALTSGMSIALDEDVFIRFRDYGRYGCGAYLDDVRITAGLDLEGPQALSHAPAAVASDDGPLARITVTFDEPIDAASFAAEDVLLKDPQGAVVTPVTVTPVAGSGDTQFDLDFAAQSLRGTYRLTVGPQILDLASNPMNQNGSAVNGEAADAYGATVDFRQTVWTPAGAEPELYAEGFEDAGWDAGAPAHWSFIHNGNGTVRAVTSGTPYGGARHLRLVCDSGSSYLSQYATLAVDLSSMAGRTDVALNFRTRRGSSSTTLYVELSGDGVSFQNVWSTSLTADYTLYALDLSELTSGKGIALDEDVFIRFRHYNGYGREAYLDNVRITAGLDLEGPQALLHAPTAVASGDGPLARITVSFDEPVDLASLAAEDVLLKDPQGSVVTPVTVTPVAGSGDTQFDLDFAAQDLRGTYRLTVGPQILDLAGNPMNQNGSAVNGEAADAYGATVDFRQTARTDIGAEPELYAEGFEDAGWDGGAPAHWSFIHNGNGTVRAVTSGTPYGGMRHLRLVCDSGSSYLSQYATLAVDLSSMAGRTDVALNFRARREISTTTLYVELSGDGVSFQNVWSTSLTADYTLYALDLSELTSGMGIALDEDVFIRFRDYGRYGYGAYLDDVRITAGLDLEGPQALSHAPAAVASDDGPLARITVTFDEPVDAASFAAEDVLLKDPQGSVVTPVTVTPVAGSGDTQFDLDFAAQSLRGTYRLTVGPQVLDLAGNPMNQNGSAVNGEATDAYGATVDFRQTVWTPAGAEPELYAEGFEDAGWDGGAPAHWSFIHNGNGTVRAVTSGTPYGGARHLRLVCDSGSSYLSQYATLAVDLSSMAGRTDVALNFRTRRGSSSTTLYVELSGDGVSFQNVWSTSLAADYTLYALDLSELTSDKGIALDEDVFIRFRHYNGYGREAYLDNVRITAGLDLEGPQALSHAPTAVASGDGPLARITVTFDEPVDAASFAAEDILLKDPQGAVVTPVAVTPVAGSGDTQFDLDFAAQSLRGTYRLTVGPQILDSAGNPMNQNGNAVNGEADDAYGATVDFRQTVWTPAGAEPELYAEGFEDAAWDDGAPSHWSFVHNGNGTVRAVTSGTPYGGARHLQLIGDSGSSYSSQYAALAVDLSSMAGRADMSLSFRARRGSNSTTLYVELSGDGVSFQNVWSTSLTAGYTQYALDLSELTSDKGVALDGDVFIRFRHYGRYGYDAYLDDVRITAGLDLEGPQALSHAPTAVASGDGPLARITVTFDEPVDAASFAAEDVLLKDPQGMAVTPVTVTPVAGSGDTQFDLDFAAQSLRGTYRLTVGPQILDLAGNPMNQNGSAVNGEAADAYGATVDFRQTVWTPAGAEPELYAEDFEDAAWDGGAPSHWSFVHNGNGTVRAVTSGTPYGGARHLRLVSDSGSSYLSQYATLAVDLSSMAGRADVSLSFRARRGNSTTTLYVELSGDGVSFQSVWSASLTTDCTQYTLDLSALVSDKGIALDGDVFIRFRHYSGYGREAYLDDVRIAAGLPPFGPWVAACSLAGQSVVGPVSQFTVTFDRPINLASLNGQVRVTAPAGVLVPLTMPVDSGDEMTFTVGLASPLCLAGTYGVSVLPEVTDVYGSSLDQNKDGVSGDGYSATFTIIDSGPTAASYPFHESFDVGFGTRDCWRFTSTANGRIQLLSDGGDTALRMDSSTSAWATNAAILAIDLAGQSGVKVVWDEWNHADEAQTGDDGDGLFVSFDQGTAWTRIADLAPASSSVWQRREIDLDAALNTALGAGAWSYTGDVRIKWQHYGYYGWSSDGRQLDDFAVSWERVGPKIVSHAPTRLAVADPSMAELAFVFDKNVLPDTFTRDDIVAFAGPDGDLLPTITGISGSGAAYTVSFSEQTQAGVYAMVIGPYIHDLAMAPMDQDGSGQTHTVTDQYTARVTLGANPGVPLYEPFSNALALHAWEFWSSGKGRVQIANGRIEMDSASGYALNEAILHVNMTGVLEPVTLKFHHLNNGDETHHDGLTVGTTFTEHRNADLVAVSNDGGATWKVVHLLAGTGTFAVVLDPATTAQAPDFLVKFQQYDDSSWSSDGRAIDDVRLYLGGSTVAFGSSDQTVDEDCDTVTIPIVLSASSPLPVQVNLSITGGTATRPQDYAVTTESESPTTATARTP